MTASPHRLQLKGNEAALRALTVLVAMAEAGRPVRATWLAEATGLNRTTVLRALAALQHYQLAEQDPDTGQFRLGIGVLRLSAGYLSAYTLAGAALPEIERLRDSTTETVSLYVRDGTERVCIQRAESPQAVRRSIQVGQRLPLHRGASGKVLLAFLPPSERAALLARVALGPEFDAQAFAAEMDAIVERGYAISVEEREAGVAAVAAPVLDRQGRVRAALAVSGPSWRLRVERLHALAPLVMDGARRLTGVTVGY